MKKEKICGIYCIENVENGMKYIGKSINIKNRWSEHKNDLKYNRHSNTYLQNVYNKYEEKIFKYYIIQECDKDNISFMEIYWIAYYNSYIGDGNGYNMDRGGSGGHVGIQRSIEWGNNISAGKKGMTFTDEHKTNLSISHMGYVPTEEQRKKLAKGNTGIKKGKNTKSPFVGVSKTSDNRNWRSYICVNHKQIYLGKFENEIDAARAYDVECWELYHDISKLNFKNLYINE
jgi:group I intron endonuclease